MSELSQKLKRALEKVSYDVDDEDFNPRNEPAISLSDALIALQPFLTEFEKLERERYGENVFEFIRASLWNKDDNKPIDSQGRELKYTIEQWLYHVQDAYRTACGKEK